MKIYFANSHVTLQQKYRSVHFVNLLLLTHFITLWLIYPGLYNLYIRLIRNNPVSKTLFNNLIFDNILKYRSFRQHPVLSRDH